MPPKFREGLNPTERSIEYVEQQPHSKDSAFIISREWIATCFNSAKDVVQLEDKESGTIILKPLYKWSIAVDPPINSTFWDGYVRYTLTIKVKDQKAKLVFETGNTQSNVSWIDGKYFPEEKMPELLAYYGGIKDSLIHQLNIPSKPSDF